MKKTKRVKKTKRFGGQLTKTMKNAARVLPLLADTKDFASLPSATSNAFTILESLNKDPNESDIGIQQLNKIEKYKNDEKNKEAMLHSDEDILIDDEGKNCEDNIEKNASRFEDMEEKHQNLYERICTLFSSDENVLKLFLEMNAKQKDTLISNYNTPDKKHLVDEVSEKVLKLYNGDVIEYDDGSTELKDHNLDVNQIDTLVVFLLCLEDNDREIFLESFLDEDFDARNINLKGMINILKSKRGGKKRKLKSRKSRKLKYKRY